MSKRISSEIINRVKLLRKKGYSLPEISIGLKISRTSVLRYIKGVEILPEYLSEWSSKRGGSRRKKIKLEKKALKEGLKLVGNLSSKEKLLILSALYWAEGNKKDFILTNSDPNLIKVFVNILREILKIKDDRIKVSLRLYEDISKEKSLDYWSEIVKIPKDKFLSVHILEGKKVGKLEYGMCRVRVSKGGELIKKIVGINTAVIKNMAS